MVVFQERKEKAVILCNPYNMIDFDISLFS